MLSSYPSYVADNVRVNEYRPKDFLESYLSTSGGVKPVLTAADVLVPDLNPDGSFKYVNDPFNGGKRISGSNVKVDYPTLPEVGQPYRAFGLFGPGPRAADQGIPGGYIDRGQIRGYMKFVPGGIPASPGFDYEATREKYPEYMQDIKRGNMPVYSTVY